MKHRRISINSLHRFLKSDVRKNVLKRYKAFQILSEADLQSYVWRLLATFVKKDERPNYFKVVNKQYMKDIGLYPDIVIFRRHEPKSIPWVVLELKETKELKLRTAVRERKWLRRYRRWGCKRTYLFYVSRVGPRRVLPRTKRKDARYFFELPIVLERELRRSRSSMTIQEWTKQFRYWAKYKHH